MKPHKSILHILGIWRIYVQFCPTFPALEKVKISQFKSKMVGEGTCLLTSVQALMCTNPRDWALTTFYLH